MERLHLILFVIMELIVPQSVCNPFGYCDLNFRNAEKVGKNTRQELIPW